MQAEPTPELKSVTPNTSPRSSPKPSPRPVSKQEHAIGDSLSTVNYKEQMNASSQKQDSSPGQESNTSSSRSSNLESISGDLNAVKEKKDIPKNVEKTKKKSAWYYAIYPTYKSKSEDFKRIFKDVPDDERLVVDYSCALQKDILVHGRLYVSQNFLCFYANIFRWETNVTIKWKDVSAITKEKTALVIPNAVLISTKSEKYFFTSFATRDKTYVTLFRVWQKALLDQPMSNSELWQWVHQCYGEELGLTSDDDDYVQPGTEEDKVSTAVTAETLTENDFTTTNTDASITEQFLIEEKMEEKNVFPVLTEIHNGVLDNHIHTDLSDTTESDAEKANKFESPAICTSPHEGKQLMNEIFPLHVDQLFTLLFTSSKFFLDFHASRKTTDLTQTDWTRDPVDSSKTRVVNLTIALNNAVGPRSCQVTEAQVMSPCSRAGSLYSIDIESVNAGIPYADSFSVWMHYCIQMVSAAQSSLTVYVQIKYRKSVWHMVKGFIERNCWQGLEEYFKALGRALWTECGDIIPAVKRKSRRRRRVPSLHKPESEVLHHTSIGARSSVKVSTGSIFSSDVPTLIVFGVLILLVILNIMLYYKLWLLEDTPLYKPIDLHVLKDPPKSHEEWIKLLQKQETLHTLEMQRWQKVLKISIDLLKQIEVQLSELQRSIHPTYTNKIISIIQSRKDTVNEAQEL